MKKIYLIIFLIFLPYLSWAACTSDEGSPATWTCSGATQEEVQTAVTAASAGDTIIFPSSGSATWASGVTVGKALTINGNGTTLTSSGSLADGFFYLYNFSSTSLMRITKFIFQMNGAGRGIYSASVALAQLRIDNNTFHHGTTQMEITGAKGVIDNNYFYNSIGYSVVYSAGTRAQADASWESMAAGTSDALFIENNHFIKDANFLGSTYGTDIDTNNGGKLVIRYNTWDSTNSPASILATIYPIQLHGNACGGCDSVNEAYWENDSTARRGQSVVEIYNNTMAGRRIDRLATLRGSAALIHDNAITGTVAYNPIIYFYEEEYTLTSQFSPARTAWPAEDQTHNTFTWNNTYKGADFNAGTYGSVAWSPDTSAGLQKDRDIFLHAPCGASDTTDGYGNTCTHGKATFTDSNGGSASYPTDGDTYPTKGNMVFTETGDNAYLGYSAYTYPHPLRTEEEDPSIEFSVTVTGAGVTSSHSGTHSVLTGGSVNLVFTRYNGWNGVLAGYDSAACGAATCSQPTEGGSVTCTIAPVSAGCTVTYTATAKNLLN